MELWQATAGSEERVKAAEHLFDDPVDLDATRRFLADDANHLLIVYVGGEGAGFVSGTEITHPDKRQPELFLNELGVAERFRGRGIAKALVARIWQIARDRGCGAMWVLTDESNVAARKVYGGAGGVRAGEPQLMFEWDRSRDSP
jgi:ribosomal protein S18 acetylase RimI-like enzyme